MPRPRLGLTLRITLALAAVGLLPLLAAFFLLKRVQQEGYNDQVLATHSIAARTAAERTASFLSSLATVGQTLAANPSLLADPRSEVAQNLLVATLETRPDVAILALLDPSSALVVKAQRRDLGAAIQGLLTATPAAGAVAVAEQDGVPWLGWDFPLGNGAGRLRLVASAQALADSIRGYEIGAEEAALVVIDGDGRAIVGGHALQELAPAQLAAARTGRVAGAGAYQDGQGRPVLGAFAPVGQLGWSVVSSQPARLAEKIRLGIRRDSLRSLGLALVLVAALAALGHLGLVRPLRQMVRAQRALAGLEAPGTGDELADLRDAFEVLEDRLRRHQDLGLVFLGRYQVLELLGHGAMGTVFLGRDSKLERKVALKTVRLGTELGDARRKELVASLLREAITAARFLHPNIVAVYDVEATEDLAFVAMEYVDGTGLERLLWRRGALTEEQTVLLGLAIARALAIAHEQGVVHRDIKPSNVLLGHDGSIKVTDFGIAELISASHRASDSFFGTPGYVPPETLIDGTYGPESDLFSLGVVLYECLTGVQPFAGRDVQQTLQRSLDFQPESPRLFRPEISAELDTLVLGMLEKKAQRRLGKADEVVARLELLATGTWDATILPRDSERTEIETVGHSKLLPTLGSRGMGRT